jgi:2-polyprenylphenol 6-hydroxylase
MRRYHAIVVGAGLVGTACALALEKEGLQVALIEAHPPVEPSPDWGMRMYALSPGSQNLLEHLGAWQKMDADRLQPVYRMAVYGDGGGSITLDAYDSGVERLATIVEGSRLQWALWQLARNGTNLDVISPSCISSIKLARPVSSLVLEDGLELEAELVIGADGRDSMVRLQAGIQPIIEPYSQLGVVANFEMEKAHQGTAFQWFDTEGVLAWLPLPGKRMSMVWSTSDARARTLLSLDPRTLCEKVAAAGKNRLGKLTLSGRAAGFPLRLMRLPEIIQPGVVLVGDAAHGVHPLSGQGVNLGFGDVANLSGALAKRGRASCGDRRILASYARGRSEPVWRMQAVTDTLHHLFARRGILSGTLRNSGMSLLDCLPPVKVALVREALSVTH